MRVSKTEKHLLFFSPIVVYSDDVLMIENVIHFDVLLWSWLFFNSSPFPRRILQSFRHFLFLSKRHGSCSISEKNICRYLFVSCVSTFSNQWKNSLVLLIRCGKSEVRSEWVRVSLDFSHDPSSFLIRINVRLNAGEGALPKGRIRTY